MQTEYITLNSRLTLKKGVLIEKKVKVEAELEEGSARFFAFVFLITLLVYNAYELVYEKEYFNVVYILLVLVWIAPYAKRYYRALFVNSWKTHIRLADIAAVTTDPLAHGLETAVTLLLKNGRRKTFTFRNAESQVEGFVNSLPLQNQPAVTPV